MVEDPDSHKPLLPFVGIVINGCVWSLHMAEKTENDTVVREISHLLLYYDQIFLFRCSIC